MVPLFGAILCSPDLEVHLDLILARLKLEGLPAFHANPKNWKDEKEGIRVFTKISPSLAGELLDWSIEPLLYGHFSDTEKNTFLRNGVSLLWERDITDFFQMPLFMLKQGLCYWSVCTSNAKLDKHLALILKSFGQLVSIEGDLNQLLSKLKTSPINLVLIDWDQNNLELKKNIAQLKKIRQEKEILFIGIKNFDKDNLYRDLTYGISEVSPSLFSSAEIIEIIVRSLPVSPIQNTIVDKKIGIRRLAFEFQEKTKPMRYSLIDDFLDQKSADPSILYQNLVSVYHWLFNRSFE